MQKIVENLGIAGGNVTIITEIDGLSPSDIAQLHMECKNELINTKHTYKFANEIQQAYRQLPASEFCVWMKEFLDKNMGQ